MASASTVGPTKARTRRLQPRTAAWLTAASIFATLAVTGCKRRRENADAPGGQLTQMQTDSRIRQAIRQSSEGVIMLPSRKADAVYELPRLTEIAHELRQPAAACFLQRALETMEQDTAAAAGYAGVPDGQAKVRVRISPSGKVLRTEVLESGFDDNTVPDCVGRAIRAKRFPENQTGTNQFVDIVFWVSLGAQSQVRSPTQAALLRREQTEAAIRARNCLEGRVPAGEYEVVALNFVGRDGRTIGNRVQQDEVSDDVRSCLVAAFREIRLAAEPDTFLRPISPRAHFVVHDPADKGTRDSHVDVEGEEWLRLVKLEERANRAKKRAELLGQEDAAGEQPAARYVDEGEPAAGAQRPTANGSDASGEAKTPAGDPGKGGLKLQLGPRTQQ